jgi:uncharacterized protein GlcG (DUF336 family)
MNRINRFNSIGIVALVVVLGLSVHSLTAAKEKETTSPPEAAKLIAGSGSLVLLADAQPKTGGQPTALTTKDISLEQAHRVLEAAAKKSTEIKTKMDIAVVDAGGNLKAFARQDGAWLGSIDISIKKAKTARFFDMPTGEIGKLSQPGGPLYNIEHSNGGLITFPGGVPLKDADGTVIGAVGVSGSTVENDHAVATAGAAALGGK